MANSVKSFRDREAKSLSLRDSTAGFTPAFAPADASLAPTPFNTFIASVAAANTSVETLEITYTNNATARVSLVKTIRLTITQAMGYVKSNKSWNNQFKAVKMAADKMRGIRSSSNVGAPPSPAPGEPAPTPEKSRNRGEQAYAELAAHLEQFITAVTACTGYAPPSPAITLAAFGTLLTEFKALNSAIGTLSGQLTSVREARRALYYDGDSCLERKFQAVKSAVKGQYGQLSAEYGVVKAKSW